MTDDLKALSAAATGGEWRAEITADGRYRSIWAKGEEIATIHKYPGRPQGTTTYICALVNAHRAGELVEAGKLRELVKQLADMVRNAHVKETSYHDGRATAYEFCADALAALIGEGE